MGEGYEPRSRWEGRGTSGGPGGVTRGYGNEKREDLTGRGGGELVVLERLSAETVLWGRSVSGSWDQGLVREAYGGSDRVTGADLKPNPRSRFSGSRTSRVQNTSPG